MASKNWQRILLKCKECGGSFWMETDLNTYVVSSKDLVCDDCFVEEDEIIEEVEVPVLDEEDVNFLEDLIEELPKINGDMYKAESEELANILFRLVGAEE